MKYDFDKITDRRNSNCLKWNVGEKELPMWVADMDFPAAPEILAALEKRMAHGVFGYQALSEEWYDAYISWWQKRHGLLIEKDWLLFCAGIVPAISSIIRKLTTPGEKILLQTPVYNAFFHCIEDNGRQVAENPLIYDGKSYQIDFDDLERKLSNPETTMMIISNPHNPVGKIWGREELEKIGVLCKKHHVLVISDEIHCELTDPGCDYVPFAAVSGDCLENSITCVAPTKTFNIAGLKSSAVFIADPVLRHKVEKAFHTDGISGAGVFAVEAAVAAFTKGADWLDALREYIYENKKTAEEFIGKELPEVRIVHAEATYLLWLDCNASYEKTNCTKPLSEFLRERTGLYLSAGIQYGKNGEHFLRMNIACPKSVMMDGLHRLKEGIRAYEEKNGTP